MPGFLRSILKSATVAPPAPTLHADTTSFINRMAAAGDSLSEAKITLIDALVKDCYSIGFRNAQTPDNSLIQDCLIPIAATTLNGAMVKLWSKSEIANTATALNFAAEDVSSGLKGTANSGKRIDTGWNVADHSDFADCHLALFASDLNSAGVFGGANASVNGNSSELTLVYYFGIYRFLATQTSSGNFVDSAPGLSRAFLLATCTTLSNSTIYQDGTALASNNNPRINNRPSTNFIWFNRTDLYQATGMRAKYLALGKGISADLQSAYNALVTNFITAMESL